MTTAEKAAPTAFPRPKRLRITNTNKDRVHERLGIAFPPNRAVTVEVATGREEVALRACRDFQVEYVSGEPYRAGPNRATAAPTHVVEVEPKPEPPEPEPTVQRPASGGPRVTVGSGEAQ